MPLQDSDDSVERVGETFICIAFYTGEKTITSFSNAYNFCNGDLVDNSVSSICKLWYTNTMSERILNKELTVKQNEKYVKIQGNRIVT